MPIPFRSQILLKATHGLHGFGGGASGNFFQLWMRVVLGLSPSQIGITCASFSSVTIISAPLLCGVFDRMARPHICFSLAILVDVLLHALYPLLPAFAMCMPSENFPSWLILYMPLLILGESLHNATYALVDTVTLLALPNNLAYYGKVRLWAGLMWAVSAVISGRVMDFPGFGLNMNYLIFCAALSVIVILWTVVPIPLKTSSLEMREAFGQNEQATGVAQTAVDGVEAARAAQPSYSRRLSNFLASADWPFVECLLLMFAMGTANACMNTFVFLLIQDLGGSTSLMGISIALNMFTELPVFHFSKEIMHLLGTRGVMYVGLIAHLLRLLWYGVAWSPESVLVAEPLHGLTYALVWSNLAVIGANISPRGLEATTQGIINAVFNGIGGVTGTIVGGYLYSISPKAMFWSAASLVACSGFVMMGSDVWRKCKRASDADQRASTGEHLAQTLEC